ncbi:MAG: hypothetical protein J5709_01560 [Bacteroidales bacterium]|nr:hypothetical protein [Bacteroidales bacterium]
MKLFCEIVLILVTASIIVSCSGSKNLANEDKTMTATSLPCSEKGISDKDFFRACANATSSNINIAREKAIILAKSELGKAIIAQTTNAANKYASENAISDRSTFIKEIELTANKAIDLALKEIEPTCEKYNETNDRYTTYISMEISRISIANELIRLISTRNPNIDTERFGTLFSNSCK